MLHTRKVVSALAVDLAFAFLHLRALDLYHTPQNSLLNAYNQH